MDSAYVERLATDNNGVEYLLVGRDLFDRTVDAKGIRTEDSKETVLAFLTMIMKKNRPQKNCVDKATQFAGRFEKLCKARGMQMHSTMSKTKAAFAEGKIRSLKKKLHCYMEEYGYK